MEKGWMLRGVEGYSNGFIFYVDYKERESKSEN